jgi:demethylmenaquinone methyltransferase/2-methoxy-6-polyprenyl-1,4-benzoquinol methylase
MSKTLVDILVSYNKAAFLYDSMNLVYFFGRDKKYRSMVVDKLNIKPGHLVLVPCCGTGVDFSFLLEKINNKGTLIGVDISSEMLLQTKKRIKKGKVDLVLSEVGCLPFRDEIFDAVSISFCFKITPTFKDAIKELSRVLKPEGRIGVLTNHKPSGFLRLYGTIVTKTIGRMAKINFDVNIKEHLSRHFTILEDKKIHGGLVHLLVGEKKEKELVLAS